MVDLGPLETPEKVTGGARSDAARNFRHGKGATSPLVPRHLDGPPLQRPPMIVIRNRYSGHPIPGHGRKVDWYGKCLSSRLDVR
jgi:hypothetical protein